jgi:hypothetical protein
MLSFRSASFLVLPFVAAGSAFAQTTWFVDASAVPPGNGTPGSPYASIQYAHDQASTLSGDTLSLAPGTYTDFLWFDDNKALHLAGAGPNVTVLTGGLTVEFANGATRVEDLTLREEKVLFNRSEVIFERVVIDQIDDFTDTAVIVIEADSTLTDVRFADNEGGLSVHGPATATLTNVTFVHNSGYVSPALRGTGVSLTLVDCTFTDNEVFEESGGAIHLDNCQATIEGSTFTGNTATFGGRYGGAIAQVGGALSLSDCTFESNHSGRGGAVAILAGSCTAAGVVFRGNTAQSDGTHMFHSGQGGALFVKQGSGFTGEDCTFETNQVLPPVGVAFPEDQLGGAIFVDLGVAILRNCTIRDNAADLGGSAVYGPAELARCVITGNVNGSAGGAVHGAGLDRCTVVSNATAPASAAVLDSTLDSSIVWANAGAQLGGTSSATYSCIQGGAPGIGNIAADPQFTSLAAGTLTLTMASPCIDAGSPSAPLDPDVTPADMGALPFTWLPIGASYCSTNPNSSGATAVIAALGSTAVADDFLRLRATQTAVNHVGLFIMSQNQGFVPFFNGSQGNLCLSAPIVRLTHTPGSVSSSGPQGILHLRLGLNTLPSGVMILPGQTWHFQAWFRDTVASQPTSNTSDAVSVTFQ